MASLMLNAVNQGEISITDFVRLMAEEPARMFGIYPQKGSLQPGTDADITIVDLDQEMIIQKENLHSKSKVTAFDGFAVKGVPTETIVRGAIVMQNGEITGDKGYGRLVKPVVNKQKQVQP